MEREINEELGAQIATMGDVLFFYRGWSEQYQFWMLRLCLPATLVDQNLTPGDGMIEARFIDRREFIGLAWCAEDAPIVEHVDKIWPTS